MSAPNGLFLFAVWLLGLWLTVLLSAGAVLWLTARWQAWRIRRSAGPEGE